MTANRLAIDEKKYAKLLAKTLPSVIESEEDYERMVAQVEPLFDKGDDGLSAEEVELLKLLSSLIQEYEEKNYSLNASTPRGMLLELMDVRGKSQADISKVLGSRSRASEIIKGDRSISKEQAKRLAEFFNVSAELFI